MKLITLFLLALSQVAFSQHPEDLVSGDALAVLSIRNGYEINSQLELINKRAGIDLQNTQVINNEILSLFIKNSSDIDLSKEVLLTIEPPVLADGQKATGMFGPMPHLVLICKPKTGCELEIIPFSGVNKGTLHDGWFIASGSNNWSPPQSDSLSPIFSELPEGQLSLVIRFAKLWSQIGPLTQMAGGMMIGQMNKPGPTGVVDPKTRKQTAAISTAFRKVMQFCSQVEALSMSASIQRGKLKTEVIVVQKNPATIYVDNSLMLKMSRGLSGRALQYAMSGDFTRALMDFQLDSLGEQFDGFPVVTVTKGMRKLSDLQGDSVVSFGLDRNNGLTIAAFAEASDLEAYLAQVPVVIDEMSDQFADKFQMKLTPSVDSLTRWTVSMLGNDAQDMKVMNAVIPTDTILTFGDIDGWIGFGFGSKKSHQFAEGRNETDLSRLIESNEDISIEFAMAMDYRKFASGFLAVAKKAGTDGGKTLSKGPSAKTEIVIGMNATGYELGIEMELAGLAQLMVEMD